MALYSSTLCKHLLTFGKLKIATENSHKLAEISQILEGVPLEISNLENVSVRLPQELRAAEGGTFAGNALLKSRFVCDTFGVPALADDSGLCVDALGGLPGVDTAFYGGPQPLLAAMAKIDDRSAQFQCVISLSLPDGTDYSFAETCEGVISHALKGSAGFGFDPIFIPEGDTRVFAEMSPAEKAQYSARGKALKAFLDALHG